MYITAKIYQELFVKERIPTEFVTLLFTCFHEHIKDNSRALRNTAVNL